MARIAKNATELIGNTPLLALSGYARQAGVSAVLLGKLEYFNPAGSVKDRIALAMIEEAESAGKLRPGSVIIEPTSGNTGVGLAFVGIPRGYRVILTMPDSMSMERRLLLKAYGAEIVLTPGAQGMKGAIEEAERLHSTLPDSWIASQFDNPANPAVHERTTAQEILRDTDGKIDVFVAGVGTGGTVSGVGRALKRENPAIHIAAVEPAASPLLSGGQPAPHKIQGLGANFVPGNYDPAVVDEVITVENETAAQTSRALAQTEGVLTGISSGAALCAATKLAARKEYAHKNIVVLLPDTGTRYFSTGLFGDVESPR